MKDEILKVSQSSVAQALAADYFCIYYVNTEDDRFIEYSASPEYRAFGLPTTGDDFIGFGRKHFEQFIYPPDREIFLARFTRENVVNTLDRNTTFTMTFRLMFGERPTYVHLKVTRMIEDKGRHVVVGISSVDEQMRALEAFEKAHQDRITYSRVAQALAGDYFSIYVVNPDTGEFTEYSSADEYGQLGVEKSGGDFFSLSRTNMSRLLHPDDRERFLAVFTQDRVMQTLERDGSFTMKYRLMFGDRPVYVSMKASLLKDEHSRHLIIGTNNIDAQMHREEEYQQKVADARNRAKNDFLANMSHDIRTPMNAIVGYTNIAREHIGDAALVRDSLEKIGSSSHFLLSLINDVLDMSKIESGKMQLSLKPCDLSLVLGRIEDITSMQAKNKALQITYNRAGITHTRVMADELRIEQVLINIIGNAIKYTPEGKNVDLFAEEEPLPGQNRSRFTFRVRDTGIGISEEYLPHIFESFTREQSTTINRVQGTGLGLAITARVVELMGGTISVKSQLGEGSEFTVQLELETLEAPAGAAGEPGADEGKAGAAAGKAVEDDGKAGAATGKTAAAGWRILLVEDNDINAEIASLILSGSGIRTERARDGKEGLEMLADAGEGGYDAVLMDIQMPVMNGYEATRAIRALPGDYFRKLPIIAMSANAYDEDVRNCLEAGMDAHIAKPFNPADLMALLAEKLR